MDLGLMILSQTEKTDVMISLTRWNLKYDANPAYLHNKNGLTYVMHLESVAQSKASQEEANIIY